MVFILCFAFIFFFYLHPLPFFFTLCWMNGHSPHLLLSVSPFLELFYLLTVFGFSLLPHPYPCFSFIYFPVFDYLEPYHIVFSHRPLFQPQHSYYLFLRPSLNLYIFDCCCFIICILVSLLSFLLWVLLLALYSRLLPQAPSGLFTLLYHLTSLAFLCPFFYLLHLT